MENNDSTFHYSRVDLFPELERLEAPSYRCASVVFSLCANQPVFTYHIFNRYGDNRAFWKPICSPKLVTFVYYKAELTHIFIDDLRLKVP